MRKIYFFLIILFFSIRSLGQGQVTILSETFNGAGTPAGWIKINNSTGGNPAAADWTLRPDGYHYVDVPFIDVTFHSNDNSQFYLSNSDAQLGDITETILQSPSFSTIGYSFASLQFYHHFREYQVDTGYVEVSTNGTTWTTVNKIYAAPEDSIGAANAFAHRIVNLNAYGNIASVYIRFRYYAEFGYYWALDNVVVLASVSTPLPVSLFTFSGYRESNHNILKWSTVSEQNNRGFQPERSTDGVNYSPIGFVNSLAPSGNSNVSLNYTFTDNNFSGNRQYYRLRQVDLDGREKISTVVLIKGIKPSVLTIGGLFPNPARTEMNIIIDAPNHDEIIIQMLDMNGTLVKQKNAIVETGSNTIPVDITSLVNGTYLLKVSCQSNCGPVTSKFVKQ